ncbi:alpha/beta hydrolase-fold protein [Chitinophaga caseinilytica]|uniref:Alpha/beta hydrolase-fold protein n=1 Tax=Chitinophaga caseinilytica TaxID=2267521 RepID=A0ABZ2Z294_9BACT
MKRIVLPLLFSLCSLGAIAQVKLNVQLDASLKGPYTGRLFVYTLKDTAARFTDRTMAEEPAFYLPVANWQPGESISFEKGSRPSHNALETLDPGVYKIVAILDTNTKERGNTAPGNLFSRQEGLLHIAEKGRGEGAVTLNMAFPERPFRETELAKEVKMRSALLSDFRKEDIFIKAAVILPESYAKDTSRQYPVVLIIPGWGGTHYHGAIPGNQRVFGMGQGKDKIYVYLNPETQTPWGLHAFVDSRVNGPWGKALVTELLPYLQQRFRIRKDPKQIFITGQSSGGYGAVWLALHYPASFAGCWATAPDPLDFSSFTGVDLYSAKNYYRDEAGKERGFLRMNGAFQQSQRDARMAELFAGDGGQQQSFEAEFGVAGKDGRPKELFDPQTGDIRKSVVQEWKPYDLALYVQNNWQKIKKAGVGKITVYAGTEDNFLLNESVAAFGRKAEAAGADIRVVLVPGADHFTLRNEAWAKALQAEIDALIGD